MPAGTGPYKYVEGENYVEAFDGHVNYQTPACRQDIFQGVF